MHGRSFEQSLFERRGGGMPRPCSLMEVVRMVQQAMNHEALRSAWIVHGIGECPLYIDGSTSGFSYRGSLVALRGVTAETPISVTALLATELPDEPMRRLLPLQWELGLAVGQAQPQALIDPLKRYRLLRQPDFTRLHGSLEHRWVAALLAVPCTLDEAAHGARVAREHASALMSAGLLCGLLRPMLTAEAPGQRLKRSLWRGAFGKDAQ